MATVAQRRPGAALGRSIATAARAVRVHPLVALGVLTAFSISLRALELDVHLWIDEGLSVGIASHPLSEIPGLLRQDGSPPLYYVLLHVWMAAFGTSEVATHVLSLLFAAATVPAAWWLGRSVFGERIGWTLAGLAAFDPFLTTYAQETRMYSLVVLLGMLTTGCFLHAYVYGRRVYRLPFGLGLAAMLYTHNWTLFYIVGLLVALGALWRPSSQRRTLLRDALVGFGLPAGLYLPWLPTLVSQVLHTGAPWAAQPGLGTLIHAPDLLLGGQSGTCIVLLAGGAGLATLLGRDGHERRVLVPVLASLAVVPILAAWTMSQLSPAWATRYLAVAVAPLLVLGAVGLTRAGKLGAAALALLATIWISTGAPYFKSNAYDVGRVVGPELRRGDLVVSTQPEQVPVLRYYLPGGLRYATPLGPVPDTGVVDWRNGVARLDAHTLDGTLLPLLGRMPVGQRVLLVNPIVARTSRYAAPWTKRIYDRILQYEGVLRGDPRFKLLDVEPGRRVGGPSPVQGLLFLKTRAG